MANSKKKKKAGRPPKINPSTANGNGAPESTPPAGKGKETARIDLSEAKTSLDSAKTDLESARSEVGSAAPEDTTRIDLPKPPAKVKPKAKTETSKLDLASAHPAGEKDDTSRITLPNRKSETARISLSEARPVADPADAEPDQHAETQPIAKAEKGKKEDTFRIDLDEVKPAANEQGDDFSPATSGIDTGAEKSRDAVLKQSTLRVDLSESEKSAPPAASRNQTMRVELDDKSPPPQNETARMDAPVTQAESTESVGTTRVPIDDKEGGDDVLKRRGATAAPAPATETPPVPAPPPAAPEEELPEPVAAPRNETARVSPPAEAEKSKTARIEVPAELAAPAAGRPKTIRIKRADSTAGPLQAPVPDPNVKRSKGKKGKKPTIMADDDEVGTLYSVLALVSLIVMGVVVYVLLAQTLDPSLPWIGKVSL